MKKLFLLLIIFSSCAPVYIPNSRNSPMFRKAGEFQASGHIINGIEAQAAVSVTNHFGLMGNFLYLDRSSSDRTSEDYRHHKFYEGGVGYFENQEKMFFEIFAGYGKGEGSSTDDFDISGDDIQITGKYDRFFIQPAFGWNKRTMHLAFVPRFSMVDFTEFRDVTNGISIETDEEPAFFFEPAFIGRVNFADNHMFFTFQTGLSMSFESGRYFDHRPFQMSAGLGFRLGAFRELVPAK